jgi:diketogulonate reductase-like aldo/keto reductase
VSRAEVFITTKLSERHSVDPSETLRRSLDHLGVEQVDLWLIHWPPRELSLEAMWESMCAERANGRARSVGVSNFSIELIDTLIDSSGIPPALNQIPWNPSVHSPALLEEHRKRGVTVCAYSPLRSVNLRHLTLTRIAQRHRVAPAQVVLRWNLQLGLAAVTRTSSPTRARANLRALEIALTAEEMSDVAAIGTA